MSFSTLSPSSVSALRRGRYVTRVIESVQVQDPQPQGPPDPNDPNDPTGPPRTYYRPNKTHQEFRIREDDHNREDIFVIGPQGGVYTSAVLDHGSWSGWSRIEDMGFLDGFTAAPQSSVSAIERDDHQEDIFIVGSDGGIYTNWVVDHGSWNKWIRIGEKNFTTSQSTVTAIKRDDHQVDIFVVDLNGGIYTNWVVDHGSWNKWIRIDDLSFPDGFTAQPESIVGTVRRDDHQQDIFVVGRDGVIYTNWVVDHGPWNKWLPIP